jgi:hypothetical protein
MTLEGVEPAKPGRRTASLVAFRILSPSERAVSLPSRYAGALEAAYENVGLQVTPGQDATGDVRAAIAVDEDASRATGIVTVSAPEPSAFGKAVRHLLARHVDVIYADLDLHRGAADNDAVDRLNELGFSYAGLVCHGQDGHDYLRLQRLNAENVELERIVCDSEPAREILATVLADRRRVDAET